MNSFKANYQTLRSYTGPQPGATTGQLPPSPKFSKTLLKRQYVFQLLGTTTNHNRFAPSKISAGCGPGLIRINISRIQ